MSVFYAATAPAELGAGLHPHAVDGDELAAIT
jgi:hypothetical protein